MGTNLYHHTHEPVPPTLAVAADGTAYVFHRYFTDATGFSRYDPQSVTVYKMAAGASNFSEDFTRTNISGCSNTSEPKIRLDASGVAHLVYSINTSDTLSELYYLNNSAGTWSSPEVIKSQVGIGLCSGPQALGILLQGFEFTDRSGKASYKGPLL
jgi:hypothetical protein